MKFSRKRAVAMLSAAIMAAAIMLPAQDNNTRLERLREHERKIQEIIRERRIRQQQEEAERAKLAAEQAAQAAQNPGAAAVGSAPDGATGISQEEARGEPTQDKPRVLSNVVMGFKFKDDKGHADYNIIVENGDTFISEVYLFNIDGNPVDRVRLALDYDKRFLRPLRVFDSTLRQTAAETPTFRLDERDGIVIYDAKLREPLTSPEVILLRILWEARRPTPYTGIDFKFSMLEGDEDVHTAIYSSNRNILGLGDDPADGVLSGGLMIEEKGTRLAGIEERPLQGKAEELRKMYLGSIASDAKVGFQLEGPKKPVEVGDQFLVHVRLNNPEGALIDSVNFFVLYDPKVLQIVDSDRFNWIIRGINIHDGPYHTNFPWDIHKQNEVRNDRGTAAYRMALTNGSSLPSERFAAIQFRAIAPSAGTEVGFVKGRPGAPDLSSVRYFGYELLDLAGPVSNPNIVIPIQNAAVQVAQEGRPSREVNAPVASPDETAVRPLKLER